MKTNEKHKYFILSSRQSYVLGPNPQSNPVGPILLTRSNCGRPTIRIWNGRFAPEEQNECGFSPFRTGDHEYNFSSSVSSLFVAGQRAVKYCRAALALDDFSGNGLSFARRLSFATRRLTMVLVDYSRMAASSFLALRGVRRSAGALSFLVLNALLTIGAAALCISGYGLVAGLAIVILAVAPCLRCLASLHTQQWNRGSEPIRARHIQGPSGLSSSGSFATFAAIRRASSSMSSLVVPLCNKLRFNYLVGAD